MAGPSTFWPSLSPPAALWLGERMELTEAQLSDWRRDGWLHLVGVLDDTLVASLTAHVDEVAGWSATGGPGLHHREMTDAGPVLARSEDLVPHHPGLRAFITEGTMIDLAGALFGEPAVLYKEKVNYKQPGGAGFAPHQDATAYRFVDHHVSCMVPLDPATTASGCLDVAAGFDRGRLPTDEGGRIAADVAAELEWAPVETQPGDLLWFDSYTPHRSGTNTTDRPRRALYLTYNAARHGDLRSTYYADKAETFAAEGDHVGGQRVRLSISDDFLGRPVDPS